MVRGKAALGVGVIGVSLALAACASLTTGTEQEVQITSKPAGAECSIMRGNAQLAKVTTPAKVKLQRNKADLDVVCTRDGYETARGALVSEFEGMTMGNVLIGGIFGVIVDSASGASNRYRDSIHLTLGASSPQAVAEVRRDVGQQQAEAAAQAQVQLRAQAQNRRQAAALPAPAQIPDKATAGTSLHEVPLGSVVRGVQRLGRAQLPLPDGEWIVAGRAIGESTGTSRTPIGRVILVQGAGAEPDAMIVASANLVANSGGWRKSAECDRTDMQRTTVSLNEGRNVECWWINHYVHPRVTVDSGMHFIEFDGFRRERGLGGAPVFLSAGFYASDRYDFLWVRYGVRPAVAGIPDERPASWATSVWRAPRGGEDKRRAALVAWEAAWAATMLPHIRDGLAARMPAMTFSPLRPALDVASAEN